VLRTCDSQVQYICALNKKRLLTHFQLEKVAHPYNA
jgi:hypothetical protein